jgi:hypothetical protein
MPTMAGRALFNSNRLDPASRHLRDCGQRIDGFQTPARRDEINGLAGLIFL